MAVAVAAAINHVQSSVRHSDRRALYLGERDQRVVAPVKQHNWIFNPRLVVDGTEFVRFSLTQPTPKGGKISRIARS